MSSPAAQETNGLHPVFSSFTNASDVQSTVIIGAGIIGCATAHYLAQSGNTRPDTIHLVEACDELFASASGKAGGFLASDWFEPSTASLGALSFKLHKELAAQHDGGRNWGYCRSTGTSLIRGRRTLTRQSADFWSDGSSRATAAGVHEFSGDQIGPAWLTRQEGDRTETIGADDSTAQVDPLRLSQWLLRQCLSKGVRLHQPARPVRISRDKHGNMSAIRLTHGAGADIKIPCTRLLIAAGAWSGRVFDRLFPAASVQLPISQLAGYSLVVKSPRWTREHEHDGCHSVFTTSHAGFSPEIFSRLGEEIYIAGLNDPDLPLPLSPTDAQIDPDSIAEIKEVAVQLLGRGGTEISDLEILREGLCFRPVTELGMPILARVNDDALGGVTTKAVPDGGVFIAAGHGPWGISQSLGTGKVMQEMLEGEVLSADISRLDLEH